jgi:hypothetical protein
MRPSPLKTKALAFLLGLLALASPLALADWVGKDGTGTTITFDGFVNGLKQLPKHLMSNSVGVQLGTPTNPLQTTLSGSSPSNANAQQSGAWTMGMTQGSAWNVSQAGAPWSVSSSGVPWSATQSGAWNVGQSGTWTAGLSAGSNQIGNVTQSGSPWSHNLTQIKGASPSLANALPTQLSHNPGSGAAAVGTGNPVPARCISGCTASEGGLVTYSVGQDFVSPINATDLALIQGSATKTIKIQKILYTMTAGNQTNVVITVVRRSSGNTGGTSATATIAKLDKNDPAPTAVVRTYTTNPTPGTDAGIIRALSFAPQTAGGNNVIPSQVYRFGGAGGVIKPITLRGTSEYLALVSNASNGVAGFTSRLSVEWTEE